MIRVLILIGITSLSSILKMKAQDYTVQMDYIESLENEPSAEELYEIWDYYTLHPINLSDKTKLYQLAQLQLLTTNEIRLIIDFCTKLNLASIYQLQTLDIDTQSLIRIKKFISCKKLNNVQALKQTDYYIGLQFQAPQRRASLNKTYKGSPLKTLIKYRYAFNNKWRFGLTLEKDIGEPIIYDGNGVNNLAYVIQYIGGEIVKEVTLGKYDLNIGEGILFGTGYRINSPYFLTYNNNATTKTSLSPKEYNYFNGVTSKWKFRAFEMDLFASIRKPNGSTNYDNSGLFRTSTEITKYKTLKEQLIGLAAKKEIKKFKISWAGIVYHSELLPEPLVLQSLHIAKSYYNIQYVGEIASQNNQSYAIVQKINIGIGRSDFLTIQYRSREPQMLNEFKSDYSSFSNGYEKGLYYAFMHSFSKKWSFKIAFDTFKSTQLQTKSPHYPEGNKVATELVRNANSSKFVSQYQRKQIIGNDQIQKLRLLYQQQLNTQIKWSSKLNCSTQNKQWNTSIQYNVYWKSKSKKDKICISSCYFNTINESVYWQAPHFYGSYNARFLSGKGSTYSLGFQKRLNRNLKLGLQVIALSYTDREIIGSGNERVENNTKLDFAIYLKWKTRN